MNQKLTFTAFLQDEYSKKFDTLANRSDANIKKIEKDLLKFSRTGKQATRSIDELNKRIDVLTRVRRITIDTRAIKYATQEIKNLQREKDRLEGIGSGSGGGSSIFNIAGGIGVAHLAGSGLSSIKSIVSGSVDAYMNYEQIVESFKVLTKSDKIGTGLAERLNKWQQDTILGPEVFKSAQTLLSFGISIKDVEKDLLALGNVSQGNAEKLQSLTLAFAQTQSAGKLMGQDLLQYVNAGFNPLQTMVYRWQEFGFKSQRSMGQLRKDMENGTISSDMIRKAFQLATTEGGLFDGMLDRIGKTSYGTRKQLDGQIESFKIAFGERHKGLIASIHSGLNSLIGSFKRMVEIPVSQKIREEYEHLQSLRLELDLTNTSEKRRKEILEEVKRLQPDIIDATKSEKDQLSELNGKLDEYIAKKRTQLSLQTLNESFGRDMRQYNSAINERTKMEAWILNAIGVARAKGLDTKGMSFGQAQLAAKEFLLKTAKSDKATYKDEKSKDMGWRHSEEGKYLGTLYSGIAGFMEAEQDRLKALPGYQEFLNTQYELNKMLDDITGGKPGNDKDNPTKTNTSSGGSMPSISGSSKITHLVINIDSLLKGGVNIYKATAQEGAAEMKNVVTQQLLTAVNDANLAVGK